MQLVQDSVSEAEQNLIMKHANIRTFLNHYLPRNIDADMQNIMNGHKPNTVLMHCIRRISRSIDKRRPRNLNPQERASLYQHPEYLEAVRAREEQASTYRRDASYQNQARLDHMTKDVHRIFHRLYRLLRTEVRQNFSRRQAKIDIERQRSGSAIHNEETKRVLQTETQMSSEQIGLLEKLFTWPKSDSLEDEWARRNAGAKAVTEYCPVLEGGPLRGRPKGARTKRAAFSDDEFAQTVPRKRVDRDNVKSESPTVPVTLLLEEAKQHILHAEKPERCFQCFGNQLLPEHKRAQKWARYDAAVRHFRERHLRDRQCNFCEDQKEDILSQMHWQQHAGIVHRLKT
jgi:hypothetical protein